MAQDRGGESRRPSHLLAFPEHPRVGHGYPPHVHFGVLGTLTVVDSDGTSRRLGGPARRRLLAALLARVGRTVSVDTLIEDLWGDVPPATADKTLQSHVVRLRDDLGREDAGSPLITEPGGYRLGVDAWAVDSWCFERDLDAGRRALTENPVGAVALLDQALSWWRGEAYAEFPDAPFAVAERIRLTELHALAAEARTDAALSLGGAGELVPDLEARVLLEPYRERSWEQLVLALYRSGRQRDALAAYRRARERLVDDIGVDPSPPLRDLERRVLEHDPSLMSPPGIEGVVVALRSGQLAETHTLHGNVAPLSAPVSETGMLGAPRIAPAVVPICPYRGLAAYDEDDASLFVGRERLTAELAGRLVDNDLLVITGPSGAGKSSLLQAGLIPALRAGAIPGSAAWRVRVVTPGTAFAMSATAAQADLVAIDQAEELFTLDADERLPDVGPRLAALLSTGTRVILVVRADFYGRLAELAVLTGRIGAATALVGPLSEHELRRVVVEPAARHGVSVTPDLVDELVADVQGRTGTLPLVSAALAQAWDKRTGDRLTLDAYRRGGGVRGALEAMAEEEYRGLERPAKMAARRILLRLASRSGGVWVRRPVALEEAAPAQDAAARQALDALVARRLVVVDGATVELAHEALLTGWPRLRRWLDERERAADQLAHMSAAASAWNVADRPEGDLLRGARLQAILDWHGQHPDDLSPVEVDYVTSSQEAVDANLARERQGRRRLGAAVAVLAVLTMVAAAVGGVALRERSQADQASVQADARRLAALSYTSPDESTALLLAAAGYREQDSPDTRGALLSAVERDGGALWRVTTPNRDIWVGASEDGRRILAMDNSRTVLTIDPTTHTVISSYPIPGDIVSDLSPDGKTLVVCGPSYGGGTEYGRVVILDAVTGATTAVLPTTATENPDDRCALFSADGHHLVVHAVLPGPGGRKPDPATAEANGIAVYDTGRWATPAHVLRTSAAVTELATGRSRFAVQLADGDLQVRDATTLALLGSGHRPELADPCTSSTCGLALNPLGSTVVFVDPAQPDTLRSLSVDALNSTPRQGPALSSPAGPLVFSPDGLRLATLEANHTVAVFDAADLTATVTRNGGGAPLTSLSWRGPATQPELLTSGLDGAIASWDLDAVPRMVHLGGRVPADDGDTSRYGDVIVGTRPGPDGTQVFRQDAITGTVTAWPVSWPADEVLQWLLGDSDGSRVVLSLSRPDGSPHFIVYDMTSGRVLLDRTQPSWHDRQDQLIAGLTADGSQLVATASQHDVDVVDVNTGRLVRTLHVTLHDPLASHRWLIPLGPDPWGGIAIWGSAHGVGPVEPNSPTGDVKETKPSGTQLALLDIRDGKVIGQTDTGSSYASTFTWSPDRTRVVVGTLGGNLEVLNGHTLAPLAGPILAHDGFVTDATWSPDSSMILTSGTDGNLSFWDSATLRRIGSPLDLGPSSGTFAWFDARGQIRGEMPSTPDGKSADRWFTADGSPQGWLSQACSLAGNDLTPAEWRRDIGDQPFRPVCAGTGYKPIGDGP
jgi:DNA-binding SARP family transcriptional activator/WD40 repeat protein